MSISQNRRQQIEAQLAKHGITATDKAVNAVLSILKSDQRATVASATRRYATTVNPEVEPEKCARQSANSANGDKLQDSLAALSDILGDRIAEGVISKAVDKAVNRINSGDWTLNSSSKTKLDNDILEQKVIQTTDNLSFEKAMTLINRESLMVQGKDAVLKLQQAKIDFENNNKLFQLKYRNVPQIEFNSLGLSGGR